MSDRDNIYDAEYEEIPSPTAERGLPAGEIPTSQPLAVLPRPAGASEYAAFLDVATTAPPRDEGAMLAAAKRIGELLGKSAFYSFPAGQGRIEGPSIDLAYALAQAWGRCVTRCMVTESAGNRVTLRGQFVDLLTIAIIERDYTATLTPAPGKFANKPDQVDRWRVMQEQSAISKAVRGAILGGLPAWYVDAAMRAAFAAAEGTALGGKTLGAAVADTLAHFATHEIGKADLEAWLGRPVDLWTSFDIGGLRELARDIKGGRVTVAMVRGSGGSAEPAASGKDALFGKRAKAPPVKTAPAPEPERVPVETGTAEPSDEEKAAIVGEESRQAATDGRGEFR